MKYFKFAGICIILYLIFLFATGKIVYLENAFVGTFAWMFPRI